MKLMTVLVLKDMKQHTVAEHVMYYFSLQRNAGVFEKFCVVTGKQEKAVISPEELCVVTCK